MTSASNQSAPSFNRATPAKCINASEKPKSVNKRTSFQEYTEIPKTEDFVNNSTKIDNAIHNGSITSQETRQISTSRPKKYKHNFHHENIDPKLLQTAQLFVQDLLTRAKIEVQKKIASTESQALLHDDTFFQEGENTRIIDRIREEVTRRCRRFYNLFLNCLGHLP